MKNPSFANFAWMLMLATQFSAANSSGSPECSVGAIPFPPMANALFTPAPTGWQLRINASFYQPGVPIEVRIENTDPTKKLRGVLLWAQFGDVTPAGSFAVVPGPSAMWRYVALSPTAQCAQGSITHTTKTPKLQSDLVFSWTPPNLGQVNLQAFLVEDCSSNLNTNCRGAQALTQLIQLDEGIFRAGFE